MNFVKSHRAAATASAPIARSRNSWSMVGKALGAALLTLTALTAYRYAPNSTASTLPYLPLTASHLPLATSAEKDASAKDSPAQEIPDKVVPSGFTPVTYFEDNCARCHGPYGSFYGATFAENRSDEELHRVVKDMADGPGNAPIEGQQLEAEVAYHRSLIDKRPFLILSQINGTGTASITLIGETTPESEVKIVADGRLTLAKVDEHSWTATIAGDTDLTKIEIVATKGEAKTTITPTKSTYSHSESLEPVKVEAAKKE